LPAAAEDPDFAKKLYCALIRARGFDAKAIALQPTGRLWAMIEDLEWPAYRESAQWKMSSPFRTLSDR